jgi:hypothetical protein
LLGGLDNFSSPTRSFSQTQILKDNVSSRIFTKKFFDKFSLHQGHKISDHNTVAILELSTNIPGDDRVSSPIMPPDEKFV